MRVEDIEILESEGNYTRVFFKRERPLIAGSLAAFEHRLDPDNFFRSSRKHVINLNSIQAMDWDAGGNLLVTMRCGEVVALSRRQSAQFRKILAL